MGATLASVRLAFPYMARTIEQNLARRLKIPTYEPFRFTFSA